VVAADGQVQALEETATEPAAAVAKPHSVDQVRQAMRAVCHEAGGTARRAWEGWIEEQGYAVAGKTSTADGWPRGVPCNVGWFVGFAPFHDPRVAFVVALEHELEPGMPRPHGADVAAPMARRVLAALPERYLNGIPGRELREAARARAAAAAARPEPAPPESPPPPSEVQP